MPIGALLYVAVWFCPAEYAQNTDEAFMPLKTLHFFVINAIYELMLTVRIGPTSRTNVRRTGTGVQ